MHPGIAGRARRCLALACVGLLLIALFNHFNGAEPFPYSGFFVLVFAAVGIAHPPGTSLRLTPLLILAYLIPLATTGNLHPASVASLVYAVPVCLLVGETLAWVTARLGRTQEAMQQSETRFRSLVQHASDITIIVDKSGMIQYVSPSVTRILGYQPDDLLGIEALTLAHPDDMQQVRQSMGGIVTIGPSGLRAEHPYAPQRRCLAYTSRAWSPICSTSPASPAWSSIAAM